MSELLVKQNESGIVSVDITQSVPSLENAQELPLDLCGSYWTPEEPGESKRVYFIEIKTQKVLSMETGELTDLDCACFLEPKENGEAQTISNGSRRLVGILEEYYQSGFITKGTPLKITYNGKRRNKTNSFMSDNWSIKPLRINV